MMYPATLPAHQRRPNYPLIDILRAMAALLVVVYHVIILGQWILPPEMRGIRVFNIGWIGVDCFFVISGFVITLSALQDHQRQPLNYRTGFAARRLARIAPLYVLTSVLFVFLVKPDLLMAPVSDQLIQLFSHVFFVHNLFLTTGGAINGPSWSIGLEAQFYLMIMVITPWLARVSILRMLLTMVVAAWGYRYLITWVWVPGSGQTFQQFFYTTQLPGTLDEFGMGMALAMAVFRGHGRLAQWLTQSWRNCLSWTTLAVPLSLAAWYIYWPNRDYWHLTSMIVFWRSLLAGAFMSWLAVAMCMPAAHWRIFQPARYLGKISYGIYLWHTLVLLTLLEIPGLRGVPLLQRVLIGTVLLAALSWHFLERPLMQRLRLLQRHEEPLRAAP